MAGRRGKTTPQWLIRKIHNIAIAIKDETGKEPYWDDVRGRLKYYLETTAEPATQDDDEPRYYIQTHTIPGRITFQKILAGVKYPPIQEDLPWSLGISSAVGIPDDASGALAAMWGWSLVQPFRAPFTIRIARWVSKFRWLPWVGGSFHGRVLKPENMYIISVMYAAMERHAEAILDKRGMRTPLMDAIVLLAPEVRNAAQKMGFMSEWDAEWRDVDDAISLQNKEFEAYAPEVFAYSQKKSQFKAGVMNVDAPIQAADEIVSHVSEDKREIVESMWALAMKKAMRHPRWSGLPAGQEHVVNVNVLASLSDASGSGTLMDWDSPADQLIADALVIKDLVEKEGTKNSF
jgi:hypothetical protein